MPFQIKVFPVPLPVGVCGHSRKRPPSLSQGFHAASQFSGGQVGGGGQWGLWPHVGTVGQHPPLRVLTAQVCVAWN